MRKSVSISAKYPAGFATAICSALSLYAASFTLQCEVQTKMSREASIDAESCITFHGANPVGTHREAFCVGSRRSKDD